jgi:hypothetical protein
VHQLPPGLVRIQQAYENPTVQVKWLFHTYKKNSTDPWKHLLTLQVLQQRMSEEALESAQENLQIHGSTDCRAYRNNQAGMANEELPRFLQDHY